MLERSLAAHDFVVVVVVCLFLGGGGQFSCYDGMDFMTDKYT